MRDTIRNERTAYAALAQAPVSYVREGSTFRTPAPKRLHDKRKQGFSFRNLFKSGGVK